MVAQSRADEIDRRWDQLLQRWEELCQQGESPSAEELCSTCPELADELARRIALLRAFDPLLADTSRTTAVQSGPAPAGGPSREAATAQAEYRDLRFHAAGGLGEVFRARNAELNREVALKFLKPARAGDPASRRRFLQEAEITSRLEHPGVVPIYALGSDGSGAPCYAMRFIRGQTLQDALEEFHAAVAPGHDRAERSLALRDVLIRFVAVCNTVAYAHSRGIVHRDLKPGNVMLGPYDETLVVDWGLAKPFARDEAADGTGEEALTPSSGSGSPTVGVVGTLAYLSPEQAQEQPAGVGPASDVFSLGAILYAILTGAAPYHRAPDRAILETVQRCEFPAPRQIQPEVPRPLEAICLKAMAARPEDRYATALELAADVKRWLADEPVTAWREPISLRARRWRRRHRALVTSAATVLVLSLVGLAGFTTVLAGKNRELGQQRLRAEQREVLAIAAVKKFRDAVTANPELKNRSELDALRQALLKQPMEFFRDLRDQLQADRDTRPEALTKLAAASFDLARTAEEIGSIPDAIRSHSEALDLRDRLARDHPTIAPYQRDLAQSHHHIGFLLSLTGESARARDSYRQAIALREQLARDDPTVTQYQRDLAQSYQGIGVLLADTGHPAEALESFRRVIAIMERLVQDDPAETDNRSALATGHDGMGWLLRSMGRLDEALESHRRALQIRQQLARDDPNVPVYEEARASTLESIADLLWLTGHPAEALDSQRQALEIRDQLVRAHPTVTQYQEARARCYNNLGAYLADAGHPAEALESLQRTLEIRARLTREHPTVAQYQNDRAWTQNSIGEILRDTGHPAEALESFRQALEVCERLARENPSVHSYRSLLGYALNNIAEIELSQGRWSETRELLERAITEQRGAMAAMPGQPNYRLLLRVHLFNLAKVHQARNEPAEAIRLLQELLTLPHGNATDL